jgi:inner membrane protein
MSAVETLFTNPWYWIVCGAILIGLEMLLAGVFLLWIGLGAVAVGLLLVFLPELSLTWQLLLFAVTMVASLGTGIYFHRKPNAVTDAPRLNNELQGLIGRHLIAASDFVAGVGRVRVGDTTYSALCEEIVATGDQVRVTAVESGRLRVAPMLSL